MLVVVNRLLHGRTEFACKLLIFHLLVLEYRGKNIHV